MTPTSDEPKNTVNSTLTPVPKQRRQVDNDQYAAFIARILAAYTRRIATGDIEALADLAALADHFQALTVQAVADLHRFGYSWADIAARLGTTRQAAHQRFTKDKP